MVEDAKGLRGKDKQQDALTDANAGEAELPEGLQRKPKGAPNKGFKRGEPAEHVPMNKDN
jgi:hypothetical protein